MQNQEVTHVQNIFYTNKCDEFSRIYFKNFARTFFAVWENNLVNYYSTLGHMDKPLHA